MDYPEILEYRRKSEGLRQIDVARLLGCSPTTVCKSEKPYAVTKVLISEEYVDKFVNQFGRNPEDKQNLRRRLLMQRSLHLLPPLVAAEFRAMLNDQAVVATGSMPAAFRKMLAADWKSAKQRKLVSFPEDVIQSVIKGTRLLSRDEVIQLARGLKQSSEEYLFAAEYMTAGILEFLRNSGMDHELATYMTKMPKQDFDMWIDIFKYSISRYHKTHGHKAVEKPKP